eukprot:4963214-Amphidinium_carterae.1
MRKRMNPLLVRTQSCIIDYDDYDPLELPRTTHKSKVGQKWVENNSKLGLGGGVIRIMNHLTFKPFCFVVAVRMREKVPFP